MRLNSRLVIAGLLASTWCVGADAQTVVMRKAIARAPTPVSTQPSGPSTPTPTPAPTPAAEWTVGDWRFLGAAACSTTAQQERTVHCESAGKTVDASLCKGDMPISSRTAERTDGCSHAWSEGAWSAYDSQCSATARRTRTVSCKRSDGTIADASLCSGERPQSSETAERYEGCTTSWHTGEFQDPGPSCNEREQQRREVSCRRDLDNAVVDEASCSTGTRPAETREVSDLSSCHYDAADWTPYTYDSTCSATATGTRTATCRRSDGVTVPASVCTDKGVTTTQTTTAPNYDGCSHAWTASDWGPWSTSCGTASRMRDVFCESSDGRRVDGRMCAGDRPESAQTALQTSGCGYEITAWTPWAYASACSASTTRIRTATECRRSDGQTVDVETCRSAGVAIDAVETGTSNLSACSYAWTAGQWSAPSTLCGEATQTREVTCERSDGTRSVDTSLCGPSAPTATQTTSQVSGCSYEATYSGWSACGYLGTKQRQVTCTRSDRTVVEAPYCGTTQTEIAGCELSGEARGTKTHADPGESIVTSPNGQYTLTMQADGDLVITRGGAITWHSNTHFAGSVFDFQGDGNLVIYHGDEKTPFNAVWHTDTWANPDAYFVLDDVGQLTIYAAGRSPNLLFRTQGGTSQYSSPTRR